MLVFSIKTPWRHRKFEEVGEKSYSNLNQKEENQG